jgi:FdhD protein
MKTFDTIKILKIKDGSAEEIEDVVAVEKKVRISVNGKHALSLYCTPMMVREFVVGVIHNEGLINGQWCAERISVEYGEEIVADVPSTGSISEGERIITSGCAGGVSLKAEPPEEITDEASFEAGAIRNIFAEFQKKSEGYRTTGGVHSAALTDGSHILAFAEDIGRHNAVDKVIGYCLLENIPFEGKIMLASGRLSSEIVSKCARCGIPVLLSRAAPTSLAVEIAATAGLTLVGFVRGNRMNVYAGRQRILLPEEGV